MSLVKYTGNCHCGQFRYQFEHAEITTINRCDCSYCSKKGPLTIMIDSIKEIDILCGELQERQFGPRTVHHMFCGTCGTSVWGRVGDMVLLNMRTINGFDVWKKDVKQLHFANQPPPYIPPSPPQHSLVPGNGEKIYTGACHCGDVKIAVRTKPLPEELVKECNCSICIRNGLILFYPNDPSAVQIFGEENLISYSWGRKYNAHRFCKTCGVEVDLKLLGPPREIVDKMTGPQVNRYNEMMKIHPVNVRVLSEVEWSGEIGEYTEAEGKMKITREDGANDGRPYVLDPLPERKAT